MGSTHFDLFTALSKPAKFLKELQRIRIVQRYFDKGFYILLEKLQPYGRFFLLTFMLYFWQKKITGKKKFLGGKFLRNILLTEKKFQAKKKVLNLAGGSWYETVGRW